MNIILPDNCSNLDGFDITPFGEVDEGFLMCDKKEQLRSEYFKQVRSIYRELKPLMDDLNPDEIEEVNFTVTADGTITNLQVCLALRTADVPYPKLDPGQMFAILRLFHVLSQIYKLRGEFSHAEIPYSLDEQRNSMRTSLGDVICVQNGNLIRFESSRANGLSTSIMDGTFVLRNISVNYSEIYSNIGGFFPRIVSLDHMDIM